MSDPRQEALIAGDFAERQDADALNAPIEWRGLPRFAPVKRDVRLVLTFDDEAGREALIEQLGLILAKKTGQTWSAWWPPRDRDDLAALRFDFEADEQGEDEIELSPEPEPADDRSDPEPANGAQEQRAAADGPESEEDGIPTRDEIEEARRFAEARDETGNYDESGGDPW